MKFSGRNNMDMNSRGDEMINLRDCLAVLIEGRMGELVEVMKVLLLLK